MPTATGSRGTACTGSSATSASCRPGDPLNNMAMARQTFLDRMRAGRQHPSDPDRHACNPDESAEQYARELQVILWRGRAGPCPSAVRSRADGRRAGRPHRFAVSRLSGASMRPIAGWSACPRPMSSRSCLASRLTLPTLASCREMLFEVAGAEKRAILTRATRRREPAGEPRALHRRDDLAGRQGGAAGEFSWVMQQPPARWS